MKSGLITIMAMAALAAAPARAAAPVSQDDFLVATTANLVSLCDAAPTDPLYTAAKNFCHGFAVGTYRVLEIEEAASRTKRKSYCAPTPLPTREQAVSAFVQWASARPTTLARPPSDGVVEYLIATYPCKK